jgi:hypothetical protein
VSEPHRMTLRPPWEQEALPDGRVRFRRRFGRPRTLGANETVWLVGDVPTGAEVRLNGELLGVAGERFAFEVTTRLDVRNEVIVTATGPLGPVAVEVRAG